MAWDSSQINLVMLQQQRGLAVCACTLKEVRNRLSSPPGPELGNNTPCYVQIKQGACQTLICGLCPIYQRFRVRGPRLGYVFLKFATKSNILGSKGFDRSHQVTGQFYVTYGAVDGQTLARRYPSASFSTVPGDSPPLGGALSWECRQTSRFCR